MTKNNIIDNIAARTNLPKVACETIVDAFTEEVKECLINGDKLIIKGFIGFEVKERPEREGRNPKTGKIEKFPSVKTVKCKISKAIKEAINRK